jgi:hypothetical protein
MRRSWRICLANVIARAEQFLLLAGIAKAGTYLYLAVLASDFLLHPKTKSPLVIIASPLNGGSGLVGKSGCKTANACDSNAIEIRTESTAHFILAAKNTFTEALASWRNRAVSIGSRTRCEFLQLKLS